MWSLHKWNAGELAIPFSLIFSDTCRPTDYRRGARKISKLSRICFVWKWVCFSLPLHKQIYISTIKIHCFRFFFLFRQNEFCSRIFWNKHFFLVSSQEYFRGKLFSQSSATLRKKCPYSELLWLVSSRIRTGYGEIFSISPYSVRMRENTNQNNPEYGHFSRSVICDNALPCKQPCNVTLKCL